MDTAKKSKKDSPSKLGAYSCCGFWYFPQEMVLSSVFMWVLKPSFWFFSQNTKKERTLLRSYHDFISLLVRFSRDQS